MKKYRQVRVNVLTGHYMVTIGQGALDDLPEILPETLKGCTVVLITSETVGRLYGDRVAGRLRNLGPVHVFSIPDGEKAKSLATVTRIYGQMACAGIDRSAVVVSLGGGVVGDLAGFVASTYLRGVRFVQVPTTLLAQVDAAIGGKVGVNLKEGKNLVGAFYQPTAVVADTQTLGTLPLRELHAGMMEVVKYALIGDLELWKYLVSHTDVDLDFIVEASVRDKAKVVAADEREAGHRRVLNLGHTLAHALEALTHYRSFLHGEAVGIGIIYAHLVAQRMGCQSSERTAEVIDLLKRAGLQIRLPRTPFSKIRPFFDIDKKVERGALHFVLPVGHGQVKPTKGIPDVVFLRAYEDLRRLINGKD